MLTLFQGIRARRLAEQLCRELYLNEPFQGSVVCANEPTRFVVIVYQGTLISPPKLLPKPRAKCVIIAVDKFTLAAERVVDDKLYRPILR